MAVQTVCMQSKLYTCKAGRVHWNDTKLVLIIAKPYQSRMRTTAIDMLCCVWKREIE